MRLNEAVANTNQTIKTVKGEEHRPIVFLERKMKVILK